MTTQRPTSHNPARWRPKAAILATAAIAALGLATTPAFAASAAPATATLSGGPTVHEQQALNRNIAIAAGNVHTTVTTSPVLAAHNYLVNMVLDIGNIPLGAVVLCGFGPSGSGDVGWSNYGYIENDGSGPSDGNCAATGTITLTTTNDHIFAWATVYRGPAGASVGDFSMNELPVSSVVVTH
jgi:hypothetical protein